MSAVTVTRISLNYCNAALRALYRSTVPLTSLVGRCVTNRREIPPTVGAADDEGDADEEAEDPEVAEAAAGVALL